MAPGVVLGVDIGEIHDARERLLFAGLYVIMTSRSDIVSAGIQPDIVASAANRSRRNFYDHFESKEAFVVAMFRRFLLDETVLAGLDNREGSHDIETVPSDLRSTIRSWFPPAVLESIEILGTLTGAISWPAAGGLLDDILNEHNEMFDGYYAPRYETFLQQWDIALGKGWTPSDVATAVRGIADGLVMRFRPSCGEFTEEHLDLLVSTVIGVFASAAVDTSVPGQSGQSGQSGQFSTSSVVEQMGSRICRAGPEEQVKDARRALRTALLEELKQVPTNEITLPYLAGRAGLSTSAALRVAGSVKALSGMLLHDLVTSFESQLEETATASAHDQVADHLRRVSRFGLEYAPLIRCWLTFLPGSPTEDEDPLDRLVAMLDRFLATAGGPLIEGVFGQHSSHELARFLTIPFILPVNQASSPARTDFSEEILLSDRRIDTILKLCFVDDATPVTDEAISSFVATSAP